GPEQEVDSIVDIIDGYYTEIRLHALFPSIASFVPSFYAFGAVFPVLVFLLAPQFLREVYQ
ncbi:MAG: hypothetical protein Q9225_007540, partial [Loekoesia sp. 1 TL-2023]